MRPTLCDDGSMMMGGWLHGAPRAERPTSVPARWVTFVATNVGTFSHELVVPPFASGGAGRRAVGANGKIDESSSLAGAPRTCGAGAGTGVARASRGWVSLRLTSGAREPV